MALFRKGILSAIADSISMSAQINALKEKQDLLLVTAETLQALGEITNSEDYPKGIQASTELVDAIKKIDKML